MNKPILLLVVIGVLLPSVFANEEYSLGDTLYVIDSSSTPDVFGSIPVAINNLEINPILLVGGSFSDKENKIFTDFVNDYGPTEIVVIGNPGNLPGGYSYTFSDVSELINSKWTSSDELVVADPDDYESSLLLSVLASRRGIPLIVSDDENEIGSYIDQLNAETVILTSNIAIGTEAEKIELSDDEIRSEITKVTPGGVRNIILTNPQDELSLSSAILSSIRPSIIVFTSSDDSLQVKGKYVDAIDRLKLKVEYLTIFGGADSIPFLYKLKNRSRENMYWHQKNVYPADIVLYPFIDEDQWADLGVGRIVGKTSTSTSMLIAKTIAYDRISRDFNIMNVQGWEYDSRGTPDAHFWDDYWENLGSVIDSGVETVTTHERKFGEDFITRLENSGIAAIASHGDENGFYFEFQGTSYNFGYGSEEFDYFSSPTLVYTMGCLTGDVSAGGNENMPHFMLDNGAVMFLAPYIAQFGNPDVHHSNFFRRLILDGRSTGDGIKLSKNFQIMFDESLGTNVIWSEDTSIINSRQKVWGEPGEVSRMASGYALRSTSYFESHVLYGDPMFKITESYPELLPTQEIVEEKTEGNIKIRKIKMTFPNQYASLQTRWQYVGEINIPEGEEYLGAVLENNEVKYPNGRTFHKVYPMDTFVSIASDNINGKELAYFYVDLGLGQIYVRDQDAIVEYILYTTEKTFENYQNTVYLMDGNWRADIIVKNQENAQKNGPVYVRFPPYYTKDANIDDLTLNYFEMLPSYGKVDVTLGPYETKEFSVEFSEVIPFYLKNRSYGGMGNTLYSNTREAEQILENDGDKYDDEVIQDAREIISKAHLHRTMRNFDHGEKVSFQVLELLEDPDEYYMKYQPEEEEIIDEKIESQKADEQPVETLSDGDTDFVRNIMNILDELINRIMGYL